MRTFNEIMSDAEAKPAFSNGTSFEFWYDAWCASCINDPEDETLVLTRYVHLSAGERDRLNGRAMALDAHGHSDAISPLYRGTPRVHPG